jgi:hypothetical protein
MKRRNAPTLGALAQGALAVLLALCLAQPVHAAGKTRSRTQAKRKTQVILRGQHGMRASIDPATGRLLGRPSVTDASGVAPEQAGTRVLPDDASRDVPVVHLANGTDMATLDTRFQEFEVVRVGKDGKLVRDCVQGPRAAEKVKQAKPAPAKELQ